MSAPLRETRWPFIALLAVIGFGLLVLTIGSLDQRMAVLHHGSRAGLKQSGNEPSSAAFDDPAGLAGASKRESEEEINDDDTLEERIRKKFGMVKIAGVWLPAASIKGAAASGAGGALAAGESPATFAVPLYITTGRLPEVRAGEPYQTRIEAVGGVPPYAWSIERGALVESITLDRASGQLSGTTSNAGEATARVRVTDAVGAADIAEYKMRVITAPDAQIGSAMEQSAEAATPVAVVEASEPAADTPLPLRGAWRRTVVEASEPAADTPTSDTPAADTDAAPAPLTIVPATLADAKVDETYGAQFIASGGTAPYAWASLGELPAGLILTSAGVLSGTPLTSGDFVLNLMVTDQAVKSATQGFALKIAPAAPESVVSFTAFTSLRRVALGWTNPNDPSLASVLIIRNPSHPPVHESDGVLVYQGLDTSALDPSPPSGGSYYAAFAINAGGIASAPVHLAVELRSNAEPFADSVVAWNPLNANAYNQSGLPGIVLGTPKGGGIGSGSTDVVSLGAASVDDPGGAPYGGSIVISFDNNLAFDGPGADFTIFENVFYIKGATGYDPNSRMMEPAIVSASQDGVTWFTFPFDFSPRYDAKTGALNLRHPFVYNKGFAGVNPVLASGYNVDPTDPAVSGGDSFDLADLRVPGLEWIRYVRIQSTGDKWIVDADGELVRHPHTTAYKEATRGFSSAGFDLDAVTAIWINAVR